MPVTLATNSRYPRLSTEFTADNRTLYVKDTAYSNTHIKPQVCSLRVAQARWEFETQPLYWP